MCAKTSCALFVLQSRPLIVTLQMIEHTSWRDVYYVGVGYTALVVVLLTFVMEETIYDRHLSPVPQRHAAGLRYRFDTLIGITGARMGKHRPSLWAGVKSLFDVVWRPHALMMYIFVGWLFGCGIGINVTNAVRNRNLRSLMRYPASGAKQSCPS